MRSLSTPLFIAALVVALPTAAAAGEGVLSSLSLGTATSADEDGFSLSFTPRLPALGTLDRARLTLQLEPLDGADLGRGPVRSFAVDPSLGQPPRDNGRGFAVGGVLAVDDIVVRGAFRQYDTGRSQQDDVSASFAIGRLTTGVAYREVGRATGGSESRYALGAELDASHGMSVGAGVTLRSGSADVEDEATGVVRFRLSF